MVWKQEILQANLHSSKFQFLEITDLQLGHIAHILCIQVLQVLEESVWWSSGVGVEGEDIALGSRVLIYSYMLA